MPTARWRSRGVENGLFCCTGLQYSKCGVWYVCCRKEFQPKAQRSVQKMEKNGKAMIDEERKSERCEELANELTKMVNVCGNDDTAERIIDALLRQHRSLQQRFFDRFVLGFIEKVANIRKSSGTDGRNVEMKNVCDEIFKALEGSNKAFVDADGVKRIYGLPLV